MLNQINYILDKMNQDDLNVQALRALIDSINTKEKYTF